MAKEAAAPLTSSEAKVVAKAVKDGTKLETLIKEMKLPGPAVARVYWQEQVDQGVFPAISAKNDLDLGKKIISARGGSPAPRWEVLSLQTGKSIAEVKKLFTAAGGDLSKSYSGRGPRPSGAPAPAKAASTKATNGKDETKSGKASGKGRTRTRTRTRPAAAVSAESDPS